MTTSTVSRQRSVRATAAVAAVGLLSLAGVSALGPSPAGALPSAAPAPQASSRAALRHILLSHQAAGDFVGARIALLDRKGRVTEVTAGTTTVDRSSGPVDPDIPWNIGSATKTFVAVVALQLADEGLLDLDAGIDAYMPNLPDAARMTPRQLLQHTSGLGEYINDPAVRSDTNRHWTPAELIAVAEGAGRVGQPGEAYHYSNTGYIVLGEIIGQVSGRPWGDEVRTRIAEPLGLTSTREITVERPVGYQVIDGAFVDWTHGSDPSIGGAAGALQSTNTDLMVFTRALASGSLLSAESQAAMRAFIPGEDYSAYGIQHSYGLGLERYDNGTIAVVGHMGTGEAQSAFIGYDAVHGTAVAVSTNVAVSGPQAIMAIEALMAAAANA